MYTLQYDPQAMLLAYQDLFWMLVAWFVGGIVLIAVLPAVCALISFVRERLRG